MVSTRWEPRNMWSELNRLSDDFDRLFGNSSRRQVSGSVYPPLNLWEDENSLFVEAELPGLDMEHLDIMVTGGNQLSIKGERKSPEFEGGTWLRRERGYGNFNRMIELPADIDVEKVSAEFKHGVLTINLPKKEESKSRRIEVKSD